ncbi:PAS domain S-box protein [Caulobacter sp. KR2-114]|uniref:PAS domain S-box protein n=1 Tax=Caulobacter sp. KR2-114 TaxID=3400912 RepID=UPI003BFD1316
MTATGGFLIAVALLGGLALLAYAHVRAERLRGQANQQLAAAQARLRAIVETATDAILVIDETGVIQSSNPAAAAMFGWAADELLGENVTMLMPEPHRSAHAGYLAAYLAGGEGRIQRSGREVEALRKDGALLTVDLAVAEWRDGETRYFTGLLRDVTARKLVETQRQQAAQRELVVRELRHRINNMFAVIGSLVQATARSQPDVATYRDALLARVSAFGAAQVELARQGWTSRSLRELVAFELRPYGEAADRISLQGPDLELNAAAAENLSMIVHELATNAVKYGSLSDARGRLDIRWSLARAEDRLAFEWIETGGPPVAPQRRKGFGSLVIEAGARSLGGAATLTFEPAGCRCRITAPAARNLAADPQPAA